METNQSCAALTLTKALEKLPSPEGKRFATIFKHGSLLVEIYAPRGSDPQQPHTRDEVYFVATGSGEYVCGETRTTFSPNDLLFAAAGVEHRFENFTDDLAVWVLFYGPDGGEASAEEFKTEGCAVGPEISMSLRSRRKNLARGGASKASGTLGNGLDRSLLSPL